MLGIDEDDMIAFINSAAEEIFVKKASALGENINELIPNFTDISATSEGNHFSLGSANVNYLAHFRPVDSRSKARGKIVTFLKKENCDQPESRCQPGKN